MPRPNKRAEASKDRMIETAERLFAEHGLDQVSLRQIVAEAGFSNHFAVQYHFGDKAGLVRAIFEKRLAQLDQQRAERLEAADREGRGDDLRVLLDILYRPIAEQRDSTGRRSYAAFLLALQLTEVGYRLRTEQDPLAPVTRQVMNRLADLTRHLPAAVLRERSFAATVAILGGIVRRDQQTAPPLPDHCLLDDALDAAAAALAAPAAPSVLAAAKPAAG